jgi:hypothetical protein
MVYFFITGKMITPVLLDMMNTNYPDMHPRKWRGSFEEVLPYVKDVFSVILADLGKFLSEKVYISSDQRAVLMQTIAELCEPDPAHRGKRSEGGPQGARAYVAIFNALRERTSFNLRRANAG